MPMRFVLVLVALLPSACVPIVYAESKTVIREGVARTIPNVAPGVPRDAATDCVMESLEVTEIVELPNSGTFEDAARAEAFVRDALARPAVASCIGKLRGTS